MQKNQQTKIEVGQGTIEYLAIIGIVIVVALSTISLLTSFNDTDQISTNTEIIQSSSKTLALNEALLTTDGNYLIKLKSNSAESITINSITLDGEETIFDLKNQMLLGSTNYFPIYTNDECENGTKIKKNIIINFTTRYGLQKTETFENISFLCQTYEMRDEEKLAGLKPVEATGGTITFDGEYTIHTFTTSSDFEVTNGGDIELLIVAGGGGGGTGYWGGGGGAGGLIYKSEHEISIGTYPVVVGNGGALKENGENSSFDGLIAIGGGNGGGQTIGHPILLGGNGGSGGGAGWGDYGVTYGLGTNEQGNNGGTGYPKMSYGAGGGGGGAGEEGGNAAEEVPGNGGDGLEFTQFASVGGSPVGWFAGGGGSHVQNKAIYSSGGLGGGGSLTGAGTGESNTGGGGATSRAGGSGIVIIRYLTQ